jgi:MerR family transcriptional regulator, light-induced transcriptional regulator
MKPSEKIAEGLYSIRQASRMLGLPPATLRAWERRHGIPNPQRGENGYRLYSPADLEALRAIKVQTDGGIRVGIAVEALRTSLRSAGRTASLGAAYPLLLDSLVQMDESKAQEIVRQALLLHPAETVMTELFERALCWLGEQWYGDRQFITVEHFASAFFIRQLARLHAACPPPWRPGRALAACLPGEHHEIGLMMVAVGLRRRGWEVSTLGGNLPLGDLELAVHRFRPDVMLVSATLPVSPAKLDDIVGLPARMAESAPVLVLGGQAFASMGQARADASVVRAPFEQTLMTLEAILVRKAHGAAH